MTQLPTVIVLAAGRGERFKASGGTDDKLNSMLCGQRVRDHVLTAVSASGLPYHVVERTHTAHLINPGMGDSIACGVAATPQASGWLILPADLPLIQPQTLLAVAQALQQHSVVVPFFRGQKGHPVGFQASCGEALKHLRGDAGARSVLEPQNVLKLEVHDQGVVFDVDTVPLLMQAQDLMQKRHF